MKKSRMKKSKVGMKKSDDKRWAVIDEWVGSDTFITLCNSKEEALDEAESMWKHMSSSEKKKRNVRVSLIDAYDGEPWETADGLISGDEYEVAIAYSGDPKCHFTDYSFGNMDNLIIIAPVYPSSYYAYESTVNPLIDGPRFRTLTEAEKWWNENCEKYSDYDITHIFEWDNTTDYSGRIVNSELVYEESIDEIAKKRIGKTVKKRVGKTVKKGRFYLDEYDEDEKRHFTDYTLGNVDNPQAIGANFDTFEEAEEWWAENCDDKYYSDFNITHIIEWDNVVVDEEETEDGLGNTVVSGGKVFNQIVDKTPISIKKRVGKASFTMGSPQKYNGRQTYEQTPMVREAIDRHNSRESEVVKALNDRISAINKSKRNPSNSAIPSIKVPKRN